MKKNIRLLAVFMSLLASLNLTYGAKLIFNVTVPTPTYQVWITGNFNDWNNNVTQCTQVDATHFTVTLDEATFSAGTTMSNLEYKYLSGSNNWAYIETDANGADIPNRKYDVSHGVDIVARWGVVYNPTTVPLNVTIRVQTPAATKECYIVGSFNNWTISADSCKMKKIGTNADGTIIFEKKIYNRDPSLLTYSFCSGPDWRYQQKTPSGIFSYPNITPVVTEWNEIYQPPLVGTINITATVPAETKSVWLVSSIWNWSMSKAIEGKKNPNGTFTFTIPNVSSFYYRLYNQPGWDYYEVDQTTGLAKDPRFASFPGDSIINVTVFKWTRQADNIAPSIPTGLKTTVFNGNSFYLFWQAATDNTGLSGYEVYLDDILYGATINTGLDITGLEACKTYKMTVKAKDVAGNLSASSLPLFVSELTVNAGADKVSSYGGTVQFNSDSTRFIGSGTLKYKWNPSTGLSNDTIPNPTAVATNNISYTLTITSANGCSKSDMVSIRLIPMPKPEIGIVGISASNKNRIAWNKPVSTSIESYQIYRETTVSDVYEKIGTISYDSLSVFEDRESSPDVKSNKYRLSVTDRSGLESALSNPHKTIHLSINKGQNSTWNLSWEPYVGFNVSTYNIYRGTNPSNMNFFDAVSGSSTQYSDLTPPSGDIYYQLEVISPGLISPSKVSVMQKSKNGENTTTTSAISYSSSRSNIASNVTNGIPDVENSAIYIYPNPVKNKLKIQFAGGENFQILNIMGQVVYEGNLIESNTVDTSKLSAGIYFLKFSIAGTFDCKTFIKE
jgi:hypothetical protein